MTQAACARDAKRNIPDIAAFEALEFDPGSFDHEAHIHVAWQYLGKMDLLHAIDRYRSTLRRLTVRLGVPGKYHETVTWFFMITVAERLRASPGAGWNAFRQANADLFEPNGAYLKAHYTEGLLNSDRAREGFTLPDKLNSDS